MPIAHAIIKYHELRLPVDSAFLMAWLPVLDPAPTKSVVFFYSGAHLCWDYRDLIAELGRGTMTSVEFGTLGFG